MENYFEKYKDIYLNFLFQVECYKAGKNPETLIQEFSKKSFATDEEKQQQNPLDSENKQPQEEEQRKQEEINKSQNDLDFSDGYYMGETQNGLMHGKGTRYWNDGKIWEGFWEGGKANGHITVTFNGELVYDGNMIDDLPNGEGKYINPDTQRTYIGTWVNFKRDGLGKLFSESGEKIYDGEWKNDKYHGYGQYFLRDICRYEGFWEAGQRNGEGTAYDENGGVEYKGQWLNNERTEEPDWIEQATKDN